MKRKILIFLASVAFFSMPVLVFAQPDISGTGANNLLKTAAQTAQYNTAGVNEFTLSEMIGRAIKMLLMLIGTIFFVLAIYAGFLWMTAQGVEEQVKKAQGILRTATVGMIIIVASYSITAMIMLLAARSTQ